MEVGEEWAVPVGVEGRRGSHSAEEKGHFAVSSFRSGLRVEMDVSIASPPPPTVDDEEPHSLISPPRSHQACFITREVKLSDCAAAAVIFFLVPLCVYYSCADLLGARGPLACAGLLADSMTPGVVQEIPDQLQLQIQEIFFKYFFKPTPATAGGPTYVIFFSISVLLKLAKLNKNAAKITEFR